MHVRLPGADPGFGYWESQNFFVLFLPMKHSGVAQSGLGFSLLNKHSPHFGVPFYTIFEIIKY